MRTLLRGIIPARAGFTVTEPLVSGGLQDHPRSRGVYATFTLFTAIWNGSSPLARGLRPRLDSERVASRIIPARAGFTAGTPRGWSGAGDHPRSRGVYVVASGCNATFTGSSPLARGLRSHGLRRINQPGIIHARAGFTATSSTGTS